jgi:hypothetical protein
VLIFSVVLTFGGCGYKPGAKLARSVTGEKVSTSVVISQVDPENTVIIKDAVDAAILQIFHASLSDRAHSDSHLDISMSEPSYAPIQYNSDGYVVGYRARVVLRITRSTGQEVKRYNTTGTYDFAVEPNAIITDQERFIAIKNAASKAIVSFIAQVSAEGSSKN